MKCTDCEATGYSHEYWKQKILESPYWTGRLICGFDWYAKGRFHKDIDKWYRIGLEKGYTRFLMIWPRGHLKTTRIIATLVNRFLNDPEDRALLRMSSADLSEDTCRAVTDILMNSEGMKHFFPKKMFKANDPGVITNVTELRIPRKGVYRESTLEARGIDSKIVGGHFRFHANDDLIDDTAIDSEQVQEKAVNRMQRSAPLFVEPSNDISVTAGTMWPGQFYRWMTRTAKESPKYWTVHLGCYVDDRYDEFMRSIGEEPDKPHGSPIWPEQFSMEDLAALEVELGPANFANQYKNIEADSVDQRFQREDFRHYRLDDDACVVTYPGGKTYTCKLSKLYISMTIDPATGEHGRTDQSAITVCGFDRSTGMIFVLDVWQGRVLPDVLIQRIIDMVKKWKPNRVAPEDVSYQKTLKHFLRKEALQQGVPMHIRPVKPGRVSKGRRIMDALQPFVANGQVHVQKKHDRTLVDEMCSMTVEKGKVIGRSPNLADSFAYHPECWRSQELLQEQESEDDDIQMWGMEPSPAYGIECLT